MLKTIFIHQEPSIRNPCCSTAMCSRINNHFISWDAATIRQVKSILCVLAGVCENGEDAAQLIEAELTELFAIGDE